MMCHSIAQVKSTMGQADFYLEYPKLHELAASKNPVVRWLHDFSIKLNPEPHRRVFLKPFMKEQTAEFCSSCHKVHLDVPVNSYRWIRGFNEYDNWQASGVSGLGARSFYYPPKPQQCADCHMPLLPSHDFGNVNGFVHSTTSRRRIPRGPVLLRRYQAVASGRELHQERRDRGHLCHLTGAPADVRRQLARSPICPPLSQSAKSRIPWPAAADVAATPVTAPLNRVKAVVRRGDDVQVDVVVRTRKVGHFFPGGTVDAL